MQVRDIMTDQPRYCGPDMNLAAAIEIMWNYDCGLLPVIVDGRLEGVITDRDICIALGTRECAARDMVVRDVATMMAVYTCEPEDDVCAAMEVMQNAQIRRVPVVDREGRLQGIITLSDLATRIEREDGPVLNQELLGSLKAVSMRRFRKPAVRVRELLPMVAAS